MTQNTNATVYQRDRLNTDIIYCLVLNKQRKDSYCARRITIMWYIRYYMLSASLVAIATACKGATSKCVIVDMRMFSTKRHFNIRGRSLQCEMVFHHKCLYFFLSAVNFVIQKTDKLMVYSCYKISENRNMLLVQTFHSVKENYKCIKSKK